MTQRQKIKSHKPKRLPEKFNKSWVSKVESRPKWKGKNKMMIDFFEETKNIQRIESGSDVNHLFKLGVLLSKNSVLLLRIHGVRLLGFLFWGLQKQMKRAFKSVLKDLLVMLKDKKSGMIKTLIETLSAGYFLMGPKDMYDEIRVYNSQRNKDIRINLLMLIEKFITYSFEDNSIRDFILDYMGMFVSYAEDKDITVKRKLMTLLKGLIVQGRKDLGGSLVEWVENEIRKQVKGSQKMIDSLGEYSPAPQDTPKNIWVTSLHKIEIESPKPIRKIKPVSIKKKFSNKSSPAPQKEKKLTIQDSIKGLKNGSLHVCQSALSQILNFTSLPSSDNPLYKLTDSNFLDLTSGINTLFMNPTNSDGVNFQILQLLSQLFEKLNSPENNVMKRNIKSSVSNLWKKSRVDQVILREKIFNLIARLGNSSFYFPELVATSLSVIANQNVTDIKLDWNIRVINTLSCFNWFVESDMKGSTQTNQKIANLFCFTFFVSKLTMCS